MNRFTDLIVLSDGRSFAARHSALTYLSAVDVVSVGDVFVLIRPGQEPEDRMVRNVRAVHRAGVTVIESEVVRP